MSERIVGETVFWAGASGNGDMCHPVISMRTKESKTKYIVMRDLSFSDLKKAHQAAVDALSTAAISDDGKIINW